MPECSCDFGFATVDPGDQLLRLLGGLPGREGQLAEVCSSVAQLGHGACHEHIASRLHAEVEVVGSPVDQYFFSIESAVEKPLPAVFHVVETFRTVEQVVAQNFYFLGRFDCVPPVVVEVGLRGHHVLNVTEPDEVGFGVVQRQIEYLELHSELVQHSFDEVPVLAD